MAEIMVLKSNEKRGYERNPKELLDIREKVAGYQRRWRVLTWRVKAGVEKCWKNMRELGYIISMLQSIRSYYCLDVNNLLT
jgi:hypothetical protein